MASAEQVRTTINSTKKTSKITRAMELVAASKLGKTRQHMAMSKPYAEKILQVIGHVANANSEYRHDYMVKRDSVRRVGMIIVSTDRGLCGALNLNVFKEVLVKLKAWQENSIEVDLCLIGNKAASFFSRTQANVIGHASHLGDKPAVADVVGVVNVMLEAFRSGQVDEIYLVGNKFVNTMVQQPKILQLLPIQPTELEHNPEHWDYIYEPGSMEVLELLLSRYIESEVYQAVVENIACEQAARMVAMKSATDNAASIIDDLQLLYNKARQAAITQELSEIVAGSDAV